VKRKLADWQAAKAVIKRSCPYTDFQ